MKHGRFAIILILADAVAFVTTRRRSHRRLGPRSRSHPYSHICAISTQSHVHLGIYYTRRHMDLSTVPFHGIDVAGGWMTASPPYGTPTYLPQSHTFVDCISPPQVINVPQDLFY